jgi:hypothetical protein
MYQINGRVRTGRVVIGRKVEYQGVRGGWWDCVRRKGRRVPCHVGRGVVVQSSTLYDMSRLG